MDLTFITGTALFQGIREEELRLLLPCLQAREHMYQREEIILSAGNTVADIGLVLSGSVNIVLNFYWGSSHILGRVDQGSIFAENYAAIQGQELLCDVVAAEDTSVLFLNMNRLMTTCEKGCAFHQQLIRNMLRISARKNLGLSTRMMHIAPKTHRRWKTAARISGFRLTAENLLNIWASIAAHCPVNSAKCSGKA